MEKKLENPTEHKRTIENQSSVVEPIAVGKFIDKSEEPDTADELDVDEVFEDNDDETEEEGSEDTAEDSTEEEEPETPDDELEADVEEEPVQTVKPKAKQKTAKQLESQNRALKIEASKLRQQLADKESKSREDELFKEYADEYDEKEARRRARSESRQEAIERQVATLLFEKQNRRVLERYPNSENDIDKIMQFAKGGMTVEQVCRGLYGTEIPARDRRAVEALTQPDAPTGKNSSVSRAMRTPSSVTQPKLTQEQIEVKRHVDALARRQGKKPLTAKEFLEIYE